MADLAQSIRKARHTCCLDPLPHVGAPATLHLHRPTRRAHRAHQGLPVGLLVIPRGHRRRTVWGTTQTPFPLLSTPLSPLRSGAYTRHLAGDRGG